ncbi:hypothetical protein [Streptomyces qinglanensis]|uniref:hypothetical protein n=1 Tax=Streptomyces qinglanensis TaxID=943816 RepID=UPI003D72D1FF
MRVRVCRRPEWPRSCAAWRGAPLGRPIVLALSLARLRRDLDQCLLAEVEHALQHEHGISALTVLPHHVALAEGVRAGRLDAAVLGVGWKLATAVRTPADRRGA